MIDLNAAPLIPDWSHYQTPGGVQPDWPQIYDEVASGQVAGLIFKATENMGVDPAFEVFRQKAEDGKVPWLAYPFLRPGDTAATIEHFVSVVGKGVIAGLDWEIADVPAADVEQWQGICEQELGRAGLVYRGKWPPAPVTPRILEWLWWYPQYPNNPSAPPSVPVLDGTAGSPAGRAPFLWQYTGNGRLGGLSAQTDLSRLACPLDTFKHWYATGELLPWESTAAQALAAAVMPRMLTMQSSGPDVTMLQNRLGLAGYPTAGDGQFGPATRAAVIAFQTAKGLVADGIAGPTTLAALPMLNGH